jgi:hypothetical protein
MLCIQSDGKEFEIEELEHYLDLVTRTTYENNQ